MEYAGACQPKDAGSGMIDDVAAAAVVAAAAAAADGDDMVARMASSSLICSSFAVSGSRSGIGWSFCVHTRRKAIAQSKKDQSQFKELI